jgi:hypothetical protein
VGTAACCAVCDAAAPAYWLTPSLHQVIIAASACYSAVPGTKHAGRSQAGAEGCSLRLPCRIYSLIAAGAVGGGSSGGGGSSRGSDSGASADGKAAAGGDADSAAPQREEVSCLHPCPNTHCLLSTPQNTFRAEVHVPHPVSKPVCHCTLLVARGSQLHPAVVLQVTPEVMPEGDGSDPWQK